MLMNRLVHVFALIILVGAEPLAAQEKPTEEFLASHPNEFLSGAIKAL
jgi:hypothetical protein